MASSQEFECKGSGWGCKLWIGWFAFKRTFPGEWLLPLGTGWDSSPFSVRIDYFVVSEGLKDRLEGARIHTEIFGSDHCPVELTLK